MKSSIIKLCLVSLSLLVASSSINANEESIEIQSDVPVEDVFYDAPSVGLGWEDL